MKLLVFLAAACCLSQIVSAATDKVVCYHGTWARYRTGNGQYLLSHVDTSLCTHLIYSFVGLNANGSVVTLDSWLDHSLDNLNAFNKLKTSNTTMKTLLAVGGWNEGSLKYSNVACNATLRSIFVQSALTWVQTYGFDGFDLDWEYPAQRGGATVDKANFVLLLKEFREVFDKHNLLVTAAVSASGSSVDLSYDVPSLSQYLDFINVMAYDLHGSWDAVTGHNAPLYASSIDTTDAAKLLNVDSAIKGWISRGADPQKLVLGLGMYGRTFTLTSSSNVALGAAASGAGTAGTYTQEAGILSYNEICEKFAAGGWTVVWDDEQKVPYAYNGDQWVGYDNPESIAIKVQYAISMNLSGVMIWSIESEDFRGLSGTTYPLLNAVKTTLANSSSSTSSANSVVVASGDSASTNATSTTASTTASSVTTATTAASSSTSSTTASSSSSSTITCTAAGYFRDSSNCNVFYQCTQAGGVAVAQNCGTGLYFDTTSNTCNWPAAVTGC